MQIIKSIPIIQQKWSGWLKRERESTKSIRSATFALLVIAKAHSPSVLQPHHQLLWFPPPHDSSLSTTEISPDMPWSVYVCGGELLDRGKRIWTRGRRRDESDWKGGGLSAFVGQLKCLMLYADELTLFLCLSLSHPQKDALWAASIPSAGQTQKQFPHTCRH